MSRVVATPQATALGAFSEPLSFQVLGNSMDLLNIKLPQSSILNIRYNNARHNVVAVTGDSKWDVALARDAAGLIFQRCYNPNGPLSLLLSSNGARGGSSYVVLDSGMWSVRKDALLAWSHGVKLENISSNKLLSVTAQAGTDRVVIAAPGHMTQIGLEEGESIAINADCLVAVSGIQSTLDVASAPSLAVGVVPRGMQITQNLKRISAPLGRLLPDTWSQSWTEFKALSWVQATKSLWNGITHGMRSVVHMVKPHKSELITLRGPQTVFISNSMVAKDPLFVKNEITELIG